MADPIHQFEIHNLVPLGKIGGYRKSNPDRLPDPIPGVVVAGGAL